MDSDAAGSRVDSQDVDPADNPLALRLESLILGAERRYTPFQAARSAGVSGTPSAGSATKITSTSLT